MPFDLAGISNENEFYSEHYLTTVFEGDVDETFMTWRQAEKDGAVPPNRRLAKLGPAWQSLRARYLAERVDVERLRISREFADGFLHALGYERRSVLMSDAEDKLIPVLARRALPTGEDRVWVVEVPSPVGEDFDTDPLQIRFRCEQFEGIETARDVTARRKDTAEVAVTRGVFGLAEPPRFIILLSLSQAVLIDRRKWSDSRLLRFRFGEIFDRADDITIGVTAALLSAESLSPGAGTPLIDRIDEESHRHAYGVSQDLKYALRKAIEILGNEASKLIVAKRRAAKEGVFSGENALDPGRLTTECLRYMYRLLFMFFIEARPELGFAPMKAKAYRTGYSLESLRELELVPLETDEDREGHYISDTLDALFSLVFAGTPGTHGQGEAFTFHPVRAHLFDPDTIGTYLRGLRFRNDAMQQVIELLSLSNGDRGQGRGRISYAQLGISQLGAVYESLLSFSGFFATEDLVELKAKGKPAPSPLEAAFFAPKRLADDYAQGATALDGEFVYEGTAPRIYPRGTFIYRLSGRNRENSASYYTPEPLARMLVKYALKELLVGKTSDDILDLRVVEPAMGSAAFLVEVINQLADQYLELKQVEVGRRIPHESHAYERQRVRAFLADRNVFGVDLNPVAVELGQVSLWLNCLHADGFAPWFEDQVHTGNSLVGARRAVFPTSYLTARKEEDRWYNRKPREIGWSEAKRASDEVWHFLLPDPGMCAYEVNIVRPLAPEDWKTIVEWRRDFFGPLSTDEVNTVCRLSQVVDTLFDEVADGLQEMRSEVSDDLSIWPAKAHADERHVDFRDKVRRLAAFHGDGVRNSVAWRRLRAAMDAWCALWFWPIDKAAFLPSRTRYLQDLDLVLTQGVTGQTVHNEAFSTGSSQGHLFKNVLVPAKKGAEDLFQIEGRTVELRQNDLFGDSDVERLINASPWMPIAMDVAAVRRFMHFDLEFADIQRHSGGFDLVIGNPPWQKFSLSDASILSDMAPQIHLRGLRNKDIEDLKKDLLKEDLHKSVYMTAYQTISGMQSFLSSQCNFPYLGMGNPNLYQAFVDLSFRIMSPSGNAAFIHQDAHLVDPRLEDFRSEWFSRVSYHFAFRNEIVSKMFVEVNHSENYSANVYRGRAGSVAFDHISDLFLPSTVIESYAHDGVGAMPGIRHGERWDIRPHRKRIVSVTRPVIDQMTKLFSGLNGFSRFVYMHSVDTISIISAISVLQSIGTSLSGRSKTSSMWEEGAATRNGIVVPGGIFTDIPESMVIKGPCLYVGNPLYKSPKDGGRAKEDFECIDLESIPDTYLSRSNFTFTRDMSSTLKLTPSVPWDGSKKHHQHYRIAYRRMVQPARERTLAAALIAPGIQHVDTVESVSFENEVDLLQVACLLMSLPFDYFVKTMQIEDLRKSTIDSLPFVRLPDCAINLMLRLNCLTKGYTEIWERNAHKCVRLEWSKKHRILESEGKIESPTWRRDVAVRSDYARRQALLELDVLVAQALKLNCDQLIEMYRTQFHVLEENEDRTWYDAEGRIVWTSSKGLGDVGWRTVAGKKLSEKDWLETYGNIKGGEHLSCTKSEDFLPGGPKSVTRTFTGPFVVCDREADYRQAWAYFTTREQARAA